MDDVDDKIETVKELLIKEFGEDYVNENITLTKDKNWVIPLDSHKELFEYFETIAISGLRYLMLFCIFTTLFIAWLLS